MNRIIIMACAAALLAGGLFAGRAQAQVHIDFGFAHGHGHHHHHHHGWHGHHWGHYHYYPSYWYNPPVEYVYVTPPPPRTVVYGTPTVASQPVAPAPTPAVAERTTGTPTLAKRPNSLPDNEARGVTIRNPTASGGRVAFVVDGANELALNPGQVKTLGDKSSVVVEFDRGGDFGTAERELSAGSYRFVVTDEGWDLEREASNTWRTATSPAIRKNALPATRR
ncbi:MAG: hypothetical protein AB7O62_17365 [Pirellulales bacterium]